MVRAEQAPGLFSRVNVRFHLPDGPSVEVHGTVVNMTGAGFFVQFEKGIEYEALRSAVDFVTEVSGVLDVPAPDATEVLNDIPAREMGSGEHVAPTEAEFAAREAELAADEAPPEPKPAPAARPDALAGNVRPVWEMIDFGSQVPLTKQIAELNMQEKIRLARHATRPVREILIRDKDARVHIEVIKNPKITQFEIVEYTKIPKIAPEALRWVSTQRRYMRERTVVLNLVTNPNTPVDIAGRLVLTLPQNDLLRVARSTQIREAVSRKAKKKLMQQGVI